MPNSDINALIDQAAAGFLASLDAEQLRKLTDNVIDACISNLIALVNGHAIAIWLPEHRDDSDVLTIAYNVGEKGHDVEGRVSQPLDKGLVSKAFRENETICHQGIFKHKEQSTQVDRELGQVTAHQIAAPFRMLGKTIGAMTVIQTLASGIEQHSEWGFDKCDIKHFEAGVEIIQRLYELNFIRSLFNPTT